MIFFLINYVNLKKINLEIFGGHLAIFFCEDNLEIFLKIFVSRDLRFVIHCSKSRDFLSLKISRFSLNVLCGPRLFIIILIMNHNDEDNNNKNKWRRLFVAAVAASFFSSNNKAKKFTSGSIRLRDNISRNVNLEILSS